MIDMTDPSGRRATVRARLAELGPRLRELSRLIPAMGETQRFLLLSILIGVFSGLVVVCYHMAIEYLSWRTIHALEDQPWWRVMLWPALGAGVAWALVRWVFPAARGSGVNAAKAAVLVSDGYVPSTSVAGKFIASSISIGLGNPMGPEDPALQMGAGIASRLGRLFGLGRRHLRLIAPVGAAAGIGAAFNTPITAVLFVMEEVVAGWGAGALGSIVLAAVSAVVVSRWFLGDDPLFSVPDFAITHPSELLVYAAMGVVGGLLAAGFVRFTLALRARALAAPDHLTYALPVLAGLVVGAVGVWAPGTLGAGYRTIDGAMHDGFPWHMLLLLGLLKMVTASTCFSAGVPGGMFAPALFIGATVGGGLGALADLYWPFPSSSAGAYVLVGMGTFFAGLFRAPMTSIFMIFEVSASYVIILPVMIANTIAYLVTRQVHPESFLEVVARQDGLRLPSAEQEAEAPALTVEAAMVQSPGRRLPPDLAVSEALVRMQEATTEYGLVRAAGADWHYVTRAQLREATDPTMTLRNLPGGRPALRTYPDASLDSALRLLGRCPILLVSNRVNPHHVIGTLTLEDVHGAYGLSSRLES
jgi:CIC family chloride channel protein